MLSPLLDSGTLVGQTGPCLPQTDDLTRNDKRYGITVGCPESVFWGHRTRPVTPGRLGGSQEEGPWAVSSPLRHNAEGEQNNARKPWSSSFLAHELVMAGVLGRGSNTTTAGQCFKALADSLVS